MNKIEFILKHESYEALEADIRLLRKCKPKSKVLSKTNKVEGYLNMPDKPKYIIAKIKEFDGFVLGELCDVVSFTEILENRKGNELITPEKKPQDVTNADTEHEKPVKKKELRSKSTQKLTGTKPKTK